jgi:quercetin dioxygenase-like cupin family protein
MSTGHNTQALRPSIGGMLSVNIMAEIGELKAKPEWLSGDRLAVSLVKDDALNVLLMVLKKGVRLEEHRTRGPIAVYVVSGSVRFTAEQRSEEVAHGTLVALDRGVAHELEALDESIVLLITAIE